MDVRFNVHALEALRGFLGLSSGDFAYTLGISPQAYYYIVRGEHKPSAKVIMNFLALAIVSMGDNALSFLQVVQISKEDASILDFFKK